MKEEIDIDKVAISLEVERGIIDRVRKSEVRQIRLDINEDNQNLVLENIDGNLVLLTEEAPATYQGCYFYNGGVFPYALKDTLQFLVLSDGEESCLLRIIDMGTEPGTRFRYKGPGKPHEEDPDGESCIWEFSFMIVPIPEKHRTYLMRWNPAVSSYKEKDYEECVRNMKHGVFPLNWSIREWEEARLGDFFYMMRVGDDKAGIAFSGQFFSDPYPADDWAGTDKRRMYVDMVCMNPVKPGEEPLLSLSMLQKVIPEIDWAKGSSGVLLAEETVEKLVVLQKGKP